MNLIRSTEWDWFNQLILITASTSSPKITILEADITNSSHKSLISYKDYFYDALFVIFGA